MIVHDHAVEVRQPRPNKVTCFLSRYPKSVAGPLELQVSTSARYHTHK